MNITKLSCRHFRNIEQIELSDLEERNVIFGENAQGKTNLLESIWLFTGAKSFRGAKDADFIRFGESGAVNQIWYRSGGTEHEAVMKIQDHREVIFDGVKQKSPALLAGKFTAIVFSPADLSLIKDGPAIRRRFLDIAVSQLSPSYIGVLREYVRAVTQRNRVIKDFKYDGSLVVMLDVFEQEIAEKGEKLIRYRRKYVEALKEFLPAVYSGISSGKENLEIEYSCSCEADALLEKLKETRKDDMMTGITSVGPHRDELDFQINGISARIYGSQGQKRSAALAVKLSEAEVIRKVTGESPVFLLDDVMSELDPARQNYVLNHIEGMQSFITCCDPSDTAGLKKGKLIPIKNGSVSEWSSI